MEQIISKDNRWVKDYTKLSSLKSYREETGHFALESVKLVCEAFQSGVTLSMVLVTEQCLERYGQSLAPVLDACPHYQIAEELESKLSMQKTPQGVYAVGEKLDKMLSMDTIKTNGRYVMLCGLQDAGNVGTILRTAEAMGIDGVIAAPSTCDFYNPKVIRGSMGSVFRMPFYHAEEELPFLLELREAGVQTCASVLDSAAESVTDLTVQEPCVLLIGNEGNGLAAETVSACTNRVTIRMRGKTESLNASAAACILLWEMMK